MTTSPNHWIIPQDIPLFPVPEHVLLPGFPQPYPVFESRYMVLLGELGRLRAKDRWIAVPRMVARHGSHYRGRPEFHPVATLGRVVGVRHIREQHVEMTVMGCARVRLEEVKSDKPYRKSRCELIPDLPCPDEEIQRQVERLLQASVDLMNVLGPLAKGLEGLLEKRSEPRMLLYRLATVLLSDPDRRQALLEELSFHKRVDVVLDAMTDLMTTAVVSPLPKKDLAAA